MIGPKLWDKQLSLQEYEEEDFFVMNLEHFLEENDLQVMILTVITSNIPDNFLQMKRKCFTDNSPGLELEEATSLPSSPHPQYHGALTHQYGHSLYKGHFTEL